MTTGYLNHEETLVSMTNSWVYVHCTSAQTNFEDHGCTGKGRHATPTTTQHFSRPMPQLLLYHTPSFVHSLCTEGCARTVRSTCVGVRNVIHVCEFIWTAATYTLLFVQVRTLFFWRTLYMYIRIRIIRSSLENTTYICMYVYTYVHTYLHTHTGSYRALCLMYVALDARCTCAIPPGLACMYVHPTDKGPLRVRVYTHR